MVENLTDYKPRKHGEAFSGGDPPSCCRGKRRVSVCAVKMNPPGAPTINATANYTWISWGAGAWSKFTAGDFHVQIKRKNQLWEVRATSTLF